MEKELKEILKLTDDNVVKTVKKLMESNDSLTSEVKTLNEDKQGLETKLSDAEKENKNLSEQLTEIEKKALADEAEVAITKFIETGKLLPKQKDFWNNRYLTDKKGTVEYLEAAVPVVEMKEQGTGNDGVSNDDPTIELSSKANILAKKEDITLQEAQNKVLAEDQGLSDRYFGKK